MHSDNLYPWAGLAGGLAGLLLIFEPPVASSKPTSYLSANTQEERIVKNKKDSLVAAQPPGRLLSGLDHSNLDYFMEIALGAEWGDAGQRIRRWHQSQLNISVQGNPTAADWRSLQQVSQEISQLTGLSLQIDGGASSRHADIEIYFAPEAQFSRLLPTYRPGNKGFFWVWWNETGIEYAKILIDSQGINERERAHLIREELTQSLGLMRDSWRQEDSIFYQGWTTTSRYSASDASVIRMLYHPSMRSGMTAREARRVLTGS